MTRVARRGAVASFSAGAVVDGRYRIEEKLGEGGMAEVFRARDSETGRALAIKVLHAAISTNPEAVERTKREGKLLSELDNPAIVSVERYGQLPSGAVFLVMELLEGETLGARMRRGPLDPVELAPIVAGTCAGLHAAHSKGVVHRDLKPDNIFLCPTDLGLQVKLLDFGISKVYGGEKLTQTGEILGTPRYMTPEQLGAEPDIDARVDVYSLGVILYEALAGKPPFLASTPTDLIIAILNAKVAPLRTARPDVPPDVEGVVMRAMSKVRAARFDTAMQLAESYIDAVGGPGAVRRLQKRGLATQAMGGMKVEEELAIAGHLPGTRPPSAPNDADPVSGNLRLGTFSGLEESPAPVAPIDKSTRMMGAAGGAALGHAATLEAAIVEPTAIPKTPVPGGRQVPRTAMMEASMSPLTLAPAPVSSAPVPSAPVPSAPVPSAPVPSAPATAPAAVAAVVTRSPSRLKSVLLVVGALLAGGITAGAAIAVYYVWSIEADAAAAPLSPETPEPVLAPAPAEPVGEPEPEPAEVEPEPEAEPAEAEPEPEAVPSAPRRRRRSRRSRQTEPQDQIVPALGPPDTETSTSTELRRLPGF